MNTDFTRPGMTAADWGRFCAALVLCAAALALRRPDALLHPQFWAEDGNLFFAQQFYREAGLFSSYSGYLHLIPRLVARLADLLPVVRAPLVYNLFSLALAAVSCAWFSLPGFEHVARDGRLRVLAGLLVAAMPGAGSVLLNLTNLQWYLAVWAMLVCLQRLPAGARRWPLFGAYLVALLTAPMALVLTPLWILRAAFRRDDRLFAGAVAAAQAGYAVWVYAQPKTAAAGISLFGSLLPALKLSISRVGLMNLIGPELLSRQNQLGLAAAGVAFAVLLGLAAFRARARAGFLLRAAVMLYLCLGSILLYLNSRGIEAPTADLYFSVGGARYFFVATAAFQLWLVSVVDGVRDDRWLRWPAAATLLLVILVGVRSMFSVQPFADTDWPRWAEGLKQARESGERFVFDVPINPRPWTIPGSHRLPADTLAVPLSEPVADGLARSGDGWQGRGRGSLTFRLDKPAYVYGVRLTYALDGPGPAPTARLSWRRSGGEFTHDRSLQDLAATGGSPADRTVWVLDRAAELRLEFEGPAFSLTSSGASLLVSPHPLTD